jgi:hypothetical protein
MGAKTLHIFPHKGGLIELQFTVYLKINVRISAFDRPYRVPYLFILAG